jgi:hypothetical protein
MTRATRKFLIATAGFVWLATALAPPGAHADPMKCSNQETTCATNCKKAARGPVTVCLTQCGARASYCMKTGCWNDGVRTFCGLAKR